MYRGCVVMDKSFAVNERLINNIFAVKLLLLVHYFCSGLMYWETFVKNHTKFSSWKLIPYMVL